MMLTPTERVVLMLLGIVAVLIVLAAVV